MAKGRQPISGSLPLIFNRAKVAITTTYSKLKGLALRKTRAPRYGQLEIPLTLITEDECPLLCSCLNISSTGAFLRLAESELEVHEGMSFHTKMLLKGVLTDVKLVVERVETDGFGVRFIN